MSYRHPSTGKWISKAEYDRLNAEDLAEEDFSDEYDWDFEFDEAEYVDE